jgi:hypothetical protein
MSSRPTTIAALLVAAVTIVAVAACGSSVAGSAQLNTEAAQTLSSSTSSTSSTSRSSTTSSSRSSTSSTQSTEDTGTEETSTEDTSIQVPTDLTDLSAFGGPCLSVSLLSLSLTLAPFATLAGGSGEYDATDLQSAISELTAGTEVPAEIAPDIEALQEVAQEASGATLSEAAALFESEKFTTASENVSKWLENNCTG